MVQLYHNRNVNKNSLLFKVDYTSRHEHTVRAQRVHEVQGTSAWTDRSGAETPRGPGDLGLDRAERRPQINFH